MFIVTISVYIMGKKMSEKIDTSDLEIANCKICGKITNDAKSICKVCFTTWYPVLKKFVDAHPGVTYMGLVMRKDPPAPRNIIYEFTQAGFIKVKE